MSIIVRSQAELPGLYVLVMEKSDGHWILRTCICDGRIFWWLELEMREIY
jgi:hypothetical protein